MAVQRRTRVLYLCRSLLQVEDFLLYLWIVKTFMSLLVLLFEPSDLKKKSLSLQTSGHGCVHLKLFLNACESGPLTGDAEAKDVVVFFHELLEQSALSCPGGAAQHHRPGSSHS